MKEPKFGELAEALGSKLSNEIAVPLLCLITKDLLGQKDELEDAGN